MSNLLDKISARDAAFEDDTDEIFESIYPFAEAIADYLGVPVEITEWTKIEVKSDNIYMTVHVHDDFINDVFRVIEVGVPKELMANGTPESVVEFLREMERQKTELNNNDEQSILDYHLAELYGEKIH
jgi:hypothetical protein